MIHKLLAGKGKMKRGLSLLLCLALLGSSVISSNVTAEAESDVTVDAVDTAEDETDDTATETAGGAGTQEASSENLSENTNTDSEDASDDGTLVISLSDDADTNRQSSDASNTSDTDFNDEIMLTAGENDRDWNPGGTSTGGSYSNHIDVRVYTSSFSFDQEITESSTQKITVNKVWNDSESVEHSSDTVSVSLVDSDGQAVSGVETITLNEDNDWSSYWSNLALDAGEYTVREVSVPGYTSSTTLVTVGEVGTSTGKVTVTGSLTVSSITSLTYIHNNGSTTLTTYTPQTSEDGYPEFHYVNGNISLSNGDEITIKVNFKATYTVTDEDGKVIASATDKEFTNYEYTETVASKDGNKGNQCSGFGYDFYVYPEELLESIITDLAYTITVTNTPITTVNIPVEKVWDDNNNEYGIRPDSVTVTLYENGKETDTKLTLTAGNDGEWKGTFENLPGKDSSGETIVYTIVETEVTGYTSTQSTAKDGTVTITNTLETVDIPITKEWNDYNNNYETRPDSIIVTLYENGEAADTLTIEEDDEGNWAGTFTNLPKYYRDDSGVVREITYRINEDTVANYTSEISGSASDGFVITNTLKKVTITIKKQVTGNMGDRTKKFNISYTTNVSDVADNTLELTDYVKNGVNDNVGTVTLPVGSTITLTETNAEGYDKITITYGNEEYVVSDNTAQAITIQDGVTEITVINYKNATPDTAVILDSAPYILLLTGVAILGGAVLFRKRKKLL